MKEVTVLYRGSTGVDKVLEQPTDVIMDWVANDLELERQILLNQPGKPTTQLKTAAITLKSSLRDLPTRRSLSVRAFPRFYECSICDCRPVRVR